MKKLIALIGAIALICSMAFPALANGSIDDLKPEILDAEILLEDIDETLKSKITLVAESTATPDASWISEAKKLLEDFNDPDITVSVADMVEDLQKLPVNAGNPQDLTALADADFASPFAKVSLDIDGKTAYSLNGKDVPVQQTLVYEQLKDRNPADFQILLINPETGKMVFIELDASTFNPATGEITVDFPFLGFYALVEK